jgi:hypothetical protein
VLSKRISSRSVNITRLCVCIGTTYLSFTFATREFIFIHSMYPARAFCAYTRAWPFRKMRSEYRGPHGEVHSEIVQCGSDEFDLGSSASRESRRRRCTREHRSRLTRFRRLHGSYANIRKYTRYLKGKKNRHICMYVCTRSCDPDIKPRSLSRHRTVTLRGRTCPR